MNPAFFQLHIFFGSRNEKVSTVCKNDLSHLPGNKLSLIKVTFI